MPFSVIIEVSNGHFSGAIGWKCFFFARTIGINGFSMVLLLLDHHHLMFFTDHCFQWFYDDFWVTQPSPFNVFQPNDHCFQWFFDGFGVTQPLPFNVFQPTDHCFQWFFDGFQISDTNGQLWF